MGYGAEDEHQFSYKEESGKGPKNWGKINPNWKICGTGKLQSPIDIIDHGVEILPSLGKLKRDYQPAPAIAKNRGHDVMVKHIPKKFYMSIIKYTVLIISLIEYIYTHTLTSKRVVGALHFKW